MKKTDNIFEEISKYYENKKYDELIDFLLKFEKSNHDEYKLFFELGKACFAGKKYDDAEKYLKKTINIDEFKLNSLDLLGKIYKNRNDEDKLIECYKSILAFDCENTAAYRELINIYFYNKKQYDVALKYIEKLLSIQKEDIYANIIKIKIYILLKKYRSEIKKECSELFNLMIEKKYSLNEFLNIAYFSVINKEYELSMYVVNCIKKYPELKKDILLFFSSFQYEFADYIKNIRIFGENVENKFAELLEQIPEYVLKVRNMIVNELEIFHKDIVLKSKPRAITVVITNRCNLKCKMCDVWKNIWDMTDNNIEEVKKIMPYLEYITWHGGEVFLHKRFLELFDFAQECNIQQEIITNGLLVNDDIIKKMIDYNIQLTLSIDGVDELTYEKIRHGAKFSKLIKVLESIKRYYKTKIDTAFKIRMNTIVSYDNYLNLFSFLNFAHKYCISEVYLFPLIFDLNNNYSLNEFVSLYAPVIEYIEKNKSELYEKANALKINIINTIPNLKTFNEKIKNGVDLKKMHFIVNENECNAYQNEEMISYDKQIIKDNKKQVMCTVPWQRLRLDRVIRPHCFCKGNVNVGIIDNNFDIDKLWNCKYVQAYRKMIINEDFKDFCNPSCYWGVIPENQYNGIV